MTLRLVYLRWKLRALRRERGRLYRERAGIEHALAVNARDAQEVEAALVCADETLRRRRFAERYPLCDR